METTRRSVMMMGLLALGITVVSAAPDQGTTAKAPSQEEIQKLIQQLGDDSFTIREEATKKLITLGKAVVPAILKEIQSNDAEVKQRAERVLEEIQSSLPFLIESLGDPDVKIRKQAIDAIERRQLENKELVKPLTAALKDKDENIREGAITALTRIDPKTLGAEVFPKKASVEGKYQKLLKRIKVPQDKANYQEFTDYGLYEGTSWAGFDNLPKGYWVYVYPHWYIWGEMGKK